MVRIPEKLKSQDIDFVIVERQGKTPMQKGWQLKEMKYDSEELNNHIANGGNYGVRGGGENNLIIVDFDSQELQDILLSQLPSTFTVRTGGGLLHLYYYSNGNSSYKIMDSKGGTLADIQGDRKQVIGPSSIHPNGNFYEVVSDEHIGFIDYDELKDMLMAFNQYVDKSVSRKESGGNNKSTKGNDDFLEMVKDRVSMKMLLDHFGVNTSLNPTACLFHDSNAGKCFGFTGPVAHCFHCLGKWNIFQIVQEHIGLSFGGAVSYICEKFGLSKEYEENQRQWAAAQVDDRERMIKEVRSEYYTALESGQNNKKNWAKASEVLVRYLKDNYKIYTVRFDEKIEMWCYSAGVYIPNGKTEIMIALREVLADGFNSYVLNMVTLKIESDTFIDPKEFFNTNYVELIPVKNGLLNVITGELSEFDNSKIFFNKIEAEYKPNAECSRIDKFLREVLAKEEDIDLFYEMAGFCLLKEYKFEKSFILVGDGRNGKSKSIELIKRLVGANNCCSLTLGGLVPDSFSISELFGKMVNLAGDIGNRDLKDTSMFKALTGRDLISAKRKFLREITFENYAKFIFACNDLPMVYDSSKGFWDRWVLLEYPYTFVTKDEMVRVENPHLFKIRDEDIIRKITTDEEMSGFLNRALEGLKRILRKRSFSSTLGAKEIKLKWVRKSNSIIAFCMDNVDENHEGFIRKKDLRKKYSDYCKRHKIRMKSDYVIKNSLVEEYGVSEERLNSLGLNSHVGEYDWCWSGISWKNRGGVNP